MKTLASFSILLLSAITWQGCGGEEEPGPVDCNNDPVELRMVDVNLNFAVQFHISGDEAKQVIAPGLFAYGKNTVVLSDV